MSEFGLVQDNSVARKQFKSPKTGNVFTLKTHISGFERMEIAQNGMMMKSTMKEVQSKTDEAIVFFTNNAADSQLKMLETYIVGWDMELDGKAVPPNKKYIKLLHPLDWTALVDEITELQNAQWGKDEESEVGESSTGSSANASSGA